MVKLYSTLASRVMYAHRELAPCITRIQYGFMAEKNIEQVEKKLQEMQEMVRNMRESLKAPDTQQHQDYIPLK